MAFKFKMSFLKEQGLSLSSFHRENLYKPFKDNLVGRSTIIFHHQAEKDKTKISETQYDEAAKHVQKVIGYDAYDCGIVDHLEPP